MLSPKLVIGLYVFMSCNCLYIPTLKISFLRSAYTSVPLSWLALTTWVRPSPCCSTAVSSPEPSCVCYVSLSVPVTLWRSTVSDPFYALSVQVLVQVKSYCAVSHLLELIRDFNSSGKPLLNSCPHRSGLSVPPTCSHGTWNFSSHSTFHSAPCLLIHFLLLLEF